MNRFGALLALVAVLPLAVSGQSGTVRYDQSTRIDLKLPPEIARNPQFMANMPKASVQPMQLRFTPQAALFGQAPAATDQVDGGGRGDAVLVTRGGGGDVMVTREIEMGAMMRMGGGFFMGGAGAGDAVAGAYTDLVEGDYVEVREFLGRTFRIPEARPTMAWKLTGEAAKFLGYPVYQAIATQDSTTIEAWFTPEIPVSAGPAQYGGLPGLILTLAVDSNRVVYTATVVDLKTPVEKISAPTDGNKVSRAEYDKIVADKQAEMAKSRRGRGN
jgi:hypothetical protein